MSATTWNFLAFQAQLQREEPEELEKLAEIVGLCLESGSDLPSAVERDTLEVMIKKSFKNWDSARTEVLLEKVATVKATQRRKQKGTSRIFGRFLKR